MADHDFLAGLVTAKSEALEVEYKAWMDTTVGESRAKLARHLAALANHGGGYLIWGVEDTTREVMGVSPFPEKHYSLDAVSAIVKRYLEPTFQCRVEWVTVDSVDYPVCIVPSHRDRPIISKSDGPQPPGGGSPVGIVKATIYIRAPGPESRRVEKSEEWTELLERCLAHRSDQLAKIMRQAIARPERNTEDIRALLQEAARETAHDFSAQASKMLGSLSESEKTLYEKMPSHFAAFAYCLVDHDGSIIGFENPLKLISRANVGMHQYAYNGWSYFLPLVNNMDGIPQMRSGKLAGNDEMYLEGARVDRGNPQNVEDYWRVYEKGLFCIAESFREDFISAKNEEREAFMGPVLCLMRVHSVLTHARLVGEETPATAKVVVYMDWRGLKGRMLRERGDYGTGTLSGLELAGDRFVKVIEVDWADLRDRYASCLRRVTVAVFRMWETVGFDPEAFLTRENMERMLQDGRMRLFGDEA